MSNCLRELIDLLKSTGIGVVSNRPLSERKLHVQSLLQLVKHPIPRPFTEWLEEVESATIGTVNVFGLDGPGNLFEQQAEYLNQGWLNIANDGCGNYYAMILNGEMKLPSPVIFVDSYAELDDAFIVASDFAAFLRGLLANEEDRFHWPFDKEKTLLLDPDLASVEKLRFPWDA